jgi:hypothetical protein
MIAHVDESIARGVEEPLPSRECHGGRWSVSTICHAAAAGQQTLASPQGAGDEDDGGLPDLC